MGRIDVKSRLYLQQKELFADAFNYYIYDGNPVIQPEKLAEQDISELSVHYESDAKETIVQRYRNVLKLTILTEDHQTAYLMPGLEAQNQVHYAIPVRNMLYDALRYKKQVEELAAFHRKSRDSRSHSRGEFLSGFYRDDRLVPVIALVRMRRNLGSCKHLSGKYCNLLNTVKTRKQGRESFQKMNDTGKWIPKRSAY